jgi:hypothetical protein
MSNADELPFRSQAFTREDFPDKFNNVVNARAELGFVMMGIQWSPDSSVAVVTFSRFVQQVPVDGFSAEDAS